ncbi:MAG: acetyl-CoA carboxylase biotin carboxyl carrier protein subunit [Bacteroidetes bacterium]|nr:acetyl-CoA carboxylase biotin carboxyl carrier protein subunit [Bacteroidota bacterium]
MAKTKKTIEKEEIIYSELVIDDAAYITLHNKMHSQRKPYVPRNPKLIKAFMPGSIPEIFVKKGDEVKEGQELLILEAMKMKNIIIAPFDGHIKSINVKLGDMVPKAFVLIEMK